MPNSTEQPDSLPRLTPKQQRFVDAYCGPARFNATQAAKMAGYSEKTAGQKGYELKKVDAVRARIDELLIANSLSAPEIIRELTDVAMRRLDEFIEVTRYDKDGNPIAAKMDASAKMKGLELLGKHHQLFTDNVQHSGGIDIAIIGVDTEQI